MRDIGTGSTATFSGQPRVGPGGHASGTCSRANFGTLNTRRTGGGPLRRVSVGAGSPSRCSRVRREITRSSIKNAASQPPSEAGSPLKAFGASLPISSRSCRRRQNDATPIPLPHLHRAARRHWSASTITHRLSIMEPRGSLPSDMSDEMVGTNRNGIGGLLNSADPTAALVEVGRWACALMENALGSSASLPPEVGRRNIFSRSSVWAHSAPHVVCEDHLEGYPRGRHRRRLASGGHHRRRAATLRRRPAPHRGRSAPYGRHPSPRRRHPARPPPSHYFILPAE